ncbi:MAG: translocation/assembly module TamB domain-containing protein [Spirochaetota bacterium]
MSPSLGRGRYYLPVLFAAVILLLPYTLRNLVVAPLAVGIAEEVVSRNLGRPVSLKVGRISGSWFWDLSLEDASFDYGEGAFPLNSASTGDVSLTYDPFRLFDADVVASVSSVNVTGLRVLFNREPTLETIEEEIEDEPDFTIRDLRRLLLREGSTPIITLDGEVSFVQSDDGSSENDRPIGVVVDGSLEEALRVELSSGEDLLALDFSSSRNGLRLLSNPEVSTIEMDVSGEVAAPVSPVSSIAGSLRVTSEPFAFEVVTWGRRLEFSGRVAEGFAERLTEWSRRLSREVILLPPEVVPGRVDFSGSLTLKEGFPPDFVSLALASSVSPLEALSGRLTLSAYRWRYGGSPETDLDLSAEWEGPEEPLRIRHLAVDAGDLGHLVADGAAVDLARMLPVTELESLDILVPDASKVLSIAGHEEPGTLDARVSVEATVSETGLTLEVSGPEKAPHLSLEARGDGLLSGRVESGSFDLSVPKETSGPELGALSASGSFSGRLFDEGGEMAPELELALENLALPPLVASGSDGRLDSLTGTLTVAGPVDHPRIELDFVAGGVHFGDVRFDVEGLIVQDERSLVIRRLNTEAQDAVSLSVDGRLPIAVGTGGVSVKNLRSSSLTVDGEFSGVGRFVPEEAEPYVPGGTTVLEGRLLEDTGDLTFRLTAEAERGEDVEDEAAPLEYSEVALSLRLVEETQDRIDAEASLHLDDREVLRQTGSLTIPGLSDAAPRFASEDTRLVSEIEMDVPLSLMPTLSSAFIYAEGVLRGNLTTEGAPGSLEHEGRLQVDNGGARFAEPLPVLTAVNGEIRLVGSEIIAESITGELGRSPFSASGTLGLDERSLEGTIEGENLLIVSQEGIRIRGDVDLAASGTLSALEVSGSVALTEGQYTRNVPLLRFDAPPTVDEEEVQLFSVPGEFGASTSLDIQATAEDSMLVENNVYRGRLSADARLSGNLEVPVLTGRLFAESGTVRLPVTDLGLTSISLEFPEDQPFSPRLQAQGDTQIRDHDVFVQAYGTLPAIEVQVSSSPPLPQEQAILLLTTGYADIEALGEGQRSVVTAGRLVGRHLASFLFGPEEAQDATAFDRLEISVGRRLSQEGNEVIEVDFRLGSGDTWYLEFERDRFDRYNLALAWRFSFR